MAGKEYSIEQVSSSVRVDRPCLGLTVCQSACTAVRVMAFYHEAVLLSGNSWHHGACDGVFFRKLVFCQKIHCTVVHAVVLFS